MALEPHQQGDERAAAKQLAAALRNIRGILAAVVMAGLAAGLLLAFQHATTGDAFLPGHKIGLERRAKFGFVKLDHARTHTVAIGLLDPVTRQASYTTTRVTVRE